MQSFVSTPSTTVFSKSIAGPNMIKSTPGFTPSLIKSTQGFSPTFPTTVATALYRTEPTVTNPPTNHQDTTATTTSTPYKTTIPPTTSTTKKAMSIRDAIYAKKRRPTKPSLQKSTTTMPATQSQEMVISEVTKAISQPVIHVQRGTTTTTKPDTVTTKPAWLR